MAFCDEPVEFPYFTVSRMYRDNAPMHYAFVGLEMSKVYGNLFKNMSNGNIPGKEDIKKLKNIFGSYTVDLWKSIIEAREPLIFLNDRIWTDDTIFKIKTKLFVYLSKPKEIFVLPTHQQLWMHINNKDEILGLMFEKEGKTTKLISYKPAIHNVPKIDNDFLTADDERTSDVRVVKEENMLLFDTIGKLYSENKARQYDPRIFLYVLNDETEWLQNNPIMEKNMVVGKKRLWNGYFQKQWPTANPKTASYDSNLKLYTDVKNQINYINDIISSVRENVSEKQEPSLEECVIWKMTLWTRPPKVEGAAPYRLNMIYNYLRTLVSEDMPFIYYTKYGDKTPNISIYEKSIENKVLTTDIIQNWVFKKLPSGRQVPKGRAGTILIKIYNYTTKDGKAKYSNLTLFQNSEISIGLSFEEYTESSVKDIETAIGKVTKLITTLNDEFLVYHKHPLYSVPKLIIENGEFVFSKYTAMQFYQVITTFKSKQIINLDVFSNFMKKYKPFADISFFSELDKDDTSLNIKYNRISEFVGLPMIFEFIDKEKLSDTRSEVIVELIMKRYGKARHQAAEIFNQWRILKTDRQVAKELLKHPGVNIELKRSEDFETGNKKKKYKYKIFISGLKSLFILRNCYFFLQSAISTFFSPEKTKTSLKNKLLIDKNIKLDFGFGNNNDVISISEGERGIDTGYTDNINTNDITISTNFDDILEPNTNNKNQKQQIEFSSTGDVNMSNETGLDPKIRLKCSSEENKLINKGTCKDVCDFPKFKLNRLQHFEPKVFRFKAKRHSQPYSRQCEEPRRPIVMAYDPSKNPKIDKKSYTYSIKYKSAKEGPEYYYLCPQAWCPICEIPLPLDKLKDIKTKNTKDGICEYATCPHGNHQVIINRKGMKEVYPGFLNPVGNPNGFCMPCCFKNNKTNSSTYKRCVDLKMDNGEKDDLGKKYISRRDKIPLAEGRYGLLPEEIEIFLEQKKCYAGNIKNGFDCLVRKGVKVAEKTKSFLNAILDLVSCLLNEKVTRKILMERLVASLTPQLFASLSGGLIKRIFKGEKQYKNYLLDPTAFVPNIYIWDIVSRPGIFSKEGFNIVIFTPHSIFCPYGQNSTDMYSLNRPTLILVKFGNVYEPVYRVQYKDSKMSIYCLQNSTDPVIQKIVTTAKKGCSNYDEINWEKASSIPTTYGVKEEVGLNNVLKKIEGKYTVKLQLTDNYSKTTAVILNNDLYIPVKPSTIDMNYPYLETDNDSDVPILSFDKTLKLLNEVVKKTDLPLKPVYSIMYKRDTSIVIGILLETNRIVPVIPIKLSKIKKSKLKVSNMFYYPDANSKNLSDEGERKRVETINEYQYKIEAFERFKYEISRYLQTKKGEVTRNKIIDIIEKPNITKKDLNTLKIIIKKLTSLLVASPKESKKKIEEVIKSKDKYASALLRSACFSHNKKTGEKDTHCVCKGNKCKLVSLIKTDFTERLLDLLLRYPIQRDEILSGTISMIDLQSSHKKIQEGEILLTGNKLDEEFNKLIYTDKKRFQLKLLRDIDMTQPTFEGVEKKAYLKIRKGTEKDIKTYSVVDLSQHWISIMNPSFRLISTNNPCDSLYYIISELASKITSKYLNSNTNYRKRENVNIENITNNNIRDIYSNFILHFDTEDLKEFVVKVIPNISKEDLDDIVDVSDFYNIYNEREKISSVDDLTERIKVGYPSYKPGKFDVIMLSYMLNLNIILLRSSISEVIGKDFVDSGLYSVLFYDPLDRETCIRFYMLQKGAVPYVSKLNSELKRLISN